MTRPRVRLPFVHENGQIRAIKPLHFLHDDPHQLSNYGVDWLGKIQQLDRRKLIRLDHLLVAYQPPIRPVGREWEAFEDIREQLQGTGVRMTNVADDEVIAEFAQEDGFAASN